MLKNLDFEIDDDVILKIYNILKYCPLPKILHQKRQRIFTIIYDNMYILGVK